MHDIAPKDILGMANALINEQTLAFWMISLETIC
jgi:hypothetical protein